MSLMLGGSTLKAFGLNRLFDILSEEEVDRILRQRGHLLKVCVQAL
jgi:hypothetical protein